uniref:Ionotropic receptor 94e n=1 Tax=Drosophila melanogaster TaxID=7227 RepID=Q9VCM4_DROME|nr:ionotropic receptor 94e [Drosophila melanogaster]AAF56134.4 ionotropic receptor 94e [Drosophila melanogaster]|eukprot:NP_001097885.2 ionotropic receptor 94e [Drosophila melanogaster]
MDCPKWILSGLCLISLVSGATVIELLGTLKLELDFEYVLLMKNRNFSLSDQVWNGTSLTKDVMDEVQVPVLQFNENVSYFLHNSISRRLVTLGFMSDANLDEHRGLLTALVANLRHMTTSRVIFLVQSKASTDFLYELFRNCWRKKLLNVIVIFQDFETTSTFYSYSNFPILQIEERIYETSLQTLPIFPDRLRNLHGYEMPVILGGTAPRMIAYRNKKGNVVYDGTVGHFMTAFQQKYNVKFVQPLQAKNPLDFAPSMQTVGAVRNETVEISISLTFPTIPPFGFSYPYEQMNWCVMLPVEADVPPFEYYTRVFELAAFLLTLGTLVLISCLLASALSLHGYATNISEFLLHDSCLRGVLGQSFVEVFRAPTLVRGIYLEICVLGILITAWYNSYFSSYVTSAPKQPPFRTYDDILASKLKVVAWKPEYAELVGRLLEFRKYETMFLVEPDFNRYLALRDTLDTRYGYMITTNRWVLINEQQKVFSRPLFQKRDDFCFFNNIPFGFPLHENSVFMEPVQKLIMELAETGLYYHWITTGFSELIDAGEMHFVDLSPHREFRAMQIQDLQYVWYGYAFMVVLSSLVWLLENLAYTVKSKTIFPTHFMQRNKK